MDISAYCFTKLAQTPDLEYSSALPAVRVRPIANESEIVVYLSKNLKLPNKPI
jgi:hypothetical protein